MRLLKVHQVKHMQDLGMTEAIDVDGTHIQVVVAKLSWAEYCVAPRLFFFFLFLIQVLVLGPLKSKDWILHNWVGASFSPYFHVKNSVYNHDKTSNSDIRVGNKRAKE